VCDFVITRLISVQIALHSVQLPLFYQCAQLLNIHLPNIMSLISGIKSERFHAILKCFWPLQLHGNIVNFLFRIQTHDFTCLFRQWHAIRLSGTKISLVSVWGSLLRTFDGIDKEMCFHENMLSFLTLWRRFLYVNLTIIYAPFVRMFSCSGEHQARLNVPTTREGV
jgi:hypothetical protein